MLVAFEVAGIPPDFEDHVLQAGATGEHSVGTLRCGPGRWGREWGLGETQTKHTLSTLIGCDMVATQGFIVSLEEEALEAEILLEK